MCKPKFQLIVDETIQNKQMRNIQLMKQFADYRK